MSIQANDFSSNSLVGNVVVSAGTILLDLGIQPMLLEGDKTFDVQFRKTPGSPLLAQSGTITLKDYSTLVSFTSNVNVIAEGNSVQFNILTSNVTGNLTLYYTTNGNVTNNDFVQGNTGSFTLIDNAAAIILTANSDLSGIPETGESFTLQIRRDSISGEVITTSNSVEIIDTSNAVGINSLTLSSNSVYGGESLLLTIDTFNAVGNNATTLYYTITGNATVYGNSFGSVIVNNNIANIQIITETDVPTNSQNQFAIELRRNSISGPIIQTTGLITVAEVPATIEATGGNIEIFNNHKYHGFTVSSNLNILKVYKEPVINYLVVAGGGSGGTGGGGGGAGGLLTGNLVLTTANIGSYTAIVGAGGVYSGNAGSNSLLSLSSLTAVGGGTGGATGSVGGTGGSGGGGGLGGSPVGYISGGGNVSGQGYPGGFGYRQDGAGTGGGGGGAGEIGGTAGALVGGYGGNGLPITWMTPTYGTPGPSAGRWFAGGSSGRSDGRAITPRPGGAGGGGTWLSPGASSIEANVNTGGGGALNGGSGIIVIRYPNIVYNPSISVVSLITSNVTEMYPDDSVVFTIRTVNAANGEIMYFDTFNASNSTFATGNTGSFTVNGNIGTIQLTGISTLDNPTFKLRVRRNSIDGPIIGSSSNVKYYGNTLIDGFISADVLLVAGGSGGGGKWSAGGGAGGLLYYGTTTPPSKLPNGGKLKFYVGNTYTVTVGAAGSAPTVGANSLITGGGLWANIISVGGQGEQTTIRGGSGRGKSYDTPAIGPADFTAGQGNMGGPSPGGVDGGGGGGAGFGGNYVNGVLTNRQVGGDGVQYPEFWWLGANVGYFAGGGGGCNNGSNTFFNGWGGLGGGGRGGITSPGSFPDRFGVPGVTNTGGGGGGTADVHPVSGGNNVQSGGSGIAVISYRGNTAVAIGGTANLTGRAGYVTHVFTGSNTFVL